MPTREDGDEEEEAQDLLLALALESDDLVCREIGGDHLYQSVT